jgi:hypothetical protein
MRLARARPGSARSSRRALRVLAAVAVAAGALVTAVAAVLAQQRAPTVTITASESSLTVGVTGQLAAGPTRFEVVKTGGEELEISIAALRPGVTLEQFTATLRGRNPEAAFELVYLDGAVALSARERRRAVTFNLRPNSRYVVVNGAGERPEVADFTVGGQSNGATVPRADASVRMVDLRFRGDTTLPRRGIVRFGTPAGLRTSRWLRRSVPAPARGRWAVRCAATTSAVSGAWWTSHRPSSHRQRSRGARSTTTRSASPDSAAT